MAAFPDARLPSRCRFLPYGRSSTGAARVRTSDGLRATVSVCFTPPVGCAERIVEAIGSARREVLVQAYEFTSPPILQALVAAHRRGVDVRVILDKVNATERYSGVNFVSDAGIRVWIDDQTAIAHSKVIVIDRALVVAGSFNLTRSAEERNVEDTLFVSSPAIAARFVANWQNRLAASTGGNREGSWAEQTR